MTLIINSENPSEHWACFTNIKDKVVLDFGCAMDGGYGPDCGTMQYWHNQGAKLAIGIDVDLSSITNPDTKFYMPQDDRTILIQDAIDSTAKIEYYISTYKPDIIKCDIEHHEQYFLNINPDVFKLCNEYAIETHSPELRDGILELLSKNGYNVVSESRFSFVGEYYKDRYTVIYATK
jgi:hypothetical protein